MRTLLESLTSLIPAGSTGKLASRLGESETSVSRGMQAGFASILTGLVTQLQDSGAMRRIFELFSSKSNDTRVLDNVDAYLKSDQPAGAAGGTFLSSLFGGRAGEISEVIARASGLRSGSASSLLGMAAPLVLGFFGRQIRQEGLDAAGLTSMLASQKESILAAAPAGLGNLLGLGDTVSRAGAAVDPDTLRVAPVATTGGRRWLWPAAAVAAALVLFLLFRGGGTIAPVNTTDEASEATTDAPPATVTAPTSPADLGAAVVRPLPNGTELAIPENGIENQVITFIEDANRPVDETTWFDFDRLTFATGSATIQPESQEQINNIVAILQAYPAVNIKIGGYTDNTGDPAANLQLSQQRADAVRSAIVAQQIDAARVEAEGYGDQHPVADNATEEGRAQNRRIALRVTAK
ncbi:MAG: OmpA family protein [Longimicrobiales bacterium]